ncbi:helix-turn-helix domain-containing protein [Levilactobacillus tujiorum]|uniref:Helix-turn-helix transcriptional regulator n=1 Tax=Levilactobacillus tujiorum TaxID=2912243 RepID=A0ABX1L5L4_9LACO|nr:AraC family transcriptional regulator [Levilactobacillus tujiorum]MCH5465324.1 AraC family transcriptional regulator [Levilactobacillus tujiorum]NLR12520.1 helix-turn-helix transcriptional regulator [Lactobacillus sp. HBUAS51387]NLR30327.1 helix-turn-helix transcriptional regulator [Levilactobacillus tujiorum]
MLTIETNQYTFWQEKPQFLLHTDTENYWVMYIIEDGDCSYRIGNQAGQAQRNTILLCPPQVEFQRRVIHPLTFHFVRFSFTSHFFKEQDLIGHFTQASDRIMEDCTYLRQLEYCTSVEVVPLQNHFIADIFNTELYRRLFEQHHPTIHSLTIQKAIAFMVNHYQDQITINEVAQNVGWTSAYFSRRFKAEAGITPIQYLENLKMRAVQQLLITTDLPIGTIALKTGYSNGYYLSRKFSACLHTTPSKFRHTHQI